MWKETGVKPLRIIPDEDEDDDLTRLAEDVLDWCNKVKDHYPYETPQSADIKRDFNSHRKRLASSQQGENSRAEETLTPDRDKEGSDDGESDSEELISLKIKFKGRNRLLVKPRSEFHYENLLRLTAGIFPELDVANISMFTWINGDRMEEFVTDDSDLQESISEMEKLGRPVLRLEAINAGPILNSKGSGASL